MRRTSSRTFPTFGGSVLLLLRFLPLFLLECCVVVPAHANGVNTTIGNGQTVSGSVTRAGVDAYTFPVNSGDAIFVSISEVGAHAYDPEIMLYNPAGEDSANTYDAYNANLKITKAAVGTSTVKVSVWQAGAGGSYKLTVITIPDPYGSAGSILMSPGTAYRGSISRGDVAVFMFDSVEGKGHTATLTITRNSGTFDEAIRIFRPDGSEYGGTYDPSFTYPVVLTPDGGTYTVLVYRWGSGDGTDSYSISVSGNGVAVPVEPPPGSKPAPSGSGCCGIRG
jgi:hypothetical protein